MLELMAGIAVATALVLLIKEDARMIRLNRELEKRKKALEAQALEALGKGGRSL